MRSPLLHLVYEGERHDAALFPKVTERLVERYQIFKERCKKITVIFDKGNNSKDNLKEIEEAEYSFVGSLVPSHHKDLLKISTGRYDKLDDVLKVYRTKKEVFGKERTIVITFNKALYRKQLIHLNKVIKKKKAEIASFKKKLNTGKWRSKKVVAEKMRKILASKSIKGFLSFNVRKRKGKILLSVRRNQRAIYKKEKAFGKNILFTDNHSWTDEEIVQAYKGKDAIEKAFMRMKSHSMVSFMPMWHWTDQKIRVHAFCCVLSLLLLNLLRREVYQKYQQMSLERILGNLDDIKEILLFYPDKLKPVRKLSRIDETQRRIYQTLNLDRFAPQVG